MKKILILTAGFGEGHNSAARGIQEALRQVSSDVQVQVRDIFSEAFGPINEITRRAYLTAINRLPRAWARIYCWLDKQEDFRARLRWLVPARQKLIEVIRQDQPDVVVSVYPAYPHLLEQTLGPANGSSPKRVIVVTDSITINAIWFRCSTDYFVVANELSADVLRHAQVNDDLVRVLGFPVNPRFADPALRTSRSATLPWRILLMVTAGQTFAPKIARMLIDVPNVQLTVTVGRDEKLRRAIEAVRADSIHKFEIIGWTTELPRLVSSHHLLISKAGGATVQEAIAAGSPMIIDQVVPGQEEGNAQLICETGSGTIAQTPEEVIQAVSDAIADGGKLLRHWSANIAKISRPDASLQIARFLLDL